jgi:tRNA-specific 2-thiouridylase
MSGGVDSSVAAALSVEQDLQCTGITLRLFGKEIAGCLAANTNDARNTALKLGMSHHVFDFSQEFDQHVIRHFVESYEQGLTPNPCIECNRRIKFNFLLLEDCRLEFDLFVTGHYARVKHEPASGRFLLQKAIDENKDQSYVLYNLTQEQLQKVRFPLGELSKDQVWKIAENKGLINADRKESQDICFVPDGDYSSFIETYTGKTYPAGDILDLEGKTIGRHKGLIRYTIGQRRGLGVAANVPIYVTAKSITDKTVTLGKDEALFSKSLAAGNINLITCTDLKKPMRVMVKTRYLQAEQAAIAEQTADDKLHIEFDKPQRAITPGQAVVMYNGDIVIGGGTILSAAS